MKFENTLRNKLLFLWVFVSLFYSIGSGIQYSSIGIFIGVLIVTSPPIILQLIYNNHFRNKKVKKKLRNLLLLIWVIYTVMGFWLWGMNYISITYLISNREIDYISLDQGLFAFLSGLFLTSIQLIFNYLFRE
jgi:hypothetical protein